MEGRAASIFRIEGRVTRNVVSQKGGWGRGERALSRPIGTTHQHCERCPFCSKGKMTWIVNNHKLESLILENTIYVHIYLYTHIMHYI